jgi:hypothetical protein
MSKENRYQEIKEMYIKAFPDWDEEFLNKQIESAMKSYEFNEMKESVVQLACYEGLIEYSELAKVISLMSSVDLSFKNFDQSPRIQASLEDFMLDVYILVNAPLTKDILMGVAGGAAWDAIKASVKIVWCDLIGKKLNKITSQKIEVKLPSFGIKMKLGKDHSMDFHLTSEMSEDIVSDSLDKVLNFMKENINNESQFSDFNTEKVIKFSKNGKWKEIDLNEEIQKRINKQNKEK